MDETVAAVKNMVKDIMKKFFSPGLPNLAGKVAGLTWGLAVLLLLTVNTGRAQTSFASPQVLAGDYGLVTFDNTGVVPDVGAPTIAGLPPTATIWFQWTTTNSGEVEIDTFGSVDDVLGFSQLDTVLGVYTGTSLATLSLVSANDDLYPNAQFNLTGQNIYSVGDTNYLGSTNPPPIQLQSVFGAVLQPYAGPSALRFNAVAGTTYYFAVDTRGLPGLVSLNWSLHPSGVFRFATENADLTGLTYPDGVTPVLLYQVAATESTPVTGTGTDPIRYSSLNNGAGALVTVTRVAGSFGRVTVDYSTVDLSTNVDLMGATNFLLNGDLPAVAGRDYTAKSGTLTFDDFEMSKTILIPVSSGSPARPNRDFGVMLSNPQLDPSETTAVSPPRVDTTYSMAVVRVLDVNIDPAFGLSTSQFVTNIIDPITMLTNSVTNTLYSTTATNSIFNFQKANYRVYRAGASAVFTIYVNRTGTNASGASINYSVNSTFPFNKDNVAPNDNDEFPLQPGSDYATPDPQNSGNIGGRVPDFIFPNNYSGTLTWGANDFFPKPITFSVYRNSMNQFNEDFKVDIYELDSNGNPYPPGMVSSATVTILNANDVDGNNGVSNINAPAGAVDELYNADFGADFFLNTDPPQMQHPGTDGVVYGLALQPDGKTIVVGDFFSYDQTSRSCIARATASGYLDTTFNPGLGADSFITSIALTTNNESVIGGDFTSYNGSFSGHIALVGTNGALDASFNPGQGFEDPVFATVAAIATQTNGQILVGGSFSSYNGAPINNLARLNLDGSLDASFNPGTALNGSVNAIAVQPNGQIVVGGDFTAVGGIVGQDHIARFNPDGSLDTTFDPGSGTDHDHTIYAIGLQPDGNIVIGGDFTLVNGQSENGIARLTSSGALDTTFYSGTGLDGPVYSLTVQTNVIYSTTNSSFVVQTNFTIYVGGAFTSYNGTHRLGFVRVNADGTIDTSFLDTAYNQFAGLTRVYYADPVGTVQASVVQPNGDVLIGGSFQQLGGGEYNANIRSNSFIGAFPSKISRSNIRNHSNFARLHGGATEGPGNVGLNYTSYSVNKSSSSLFVGLTRTNGFLGPAAANFTVIPGLAQNGLDYLYSGNYNGSSPLYWILWEYLGPSRMHSDGLFGPNAVPTDAVFGGAWSGTKYGAVNLTVTGNTNSLNNLTASFLLSNPDMDQFYLGGENIPLGVGLGESTAPLTLIEDRHQSGTFGFAASSYVGTGLNAPIALTRTSGNYGSVSVTYTTTTNGSTAVANVDYRPTPGGSASLTFLASDTTKTFNVQILNSNYNSSVEKTVNLLLTGLNPPVNGIAYFGLTNAVLRIINPNFQGFLNLSSNSYGAPLSAGSVTITVNRSVGSKGTLAVVCATTNGTAVSGTDFIGFTNTLSWTSGDVTPRTITIPFLNSGVIGGNKQFGIRLSSPQLNGVSTPALFAATGTTNAVVTITNDNSYGTFQFSAPSYVVNENGAYSRITVIRTRYTNGTASVNFATANASAVAPANYVATNGTLTFAPGQLAASFNVVINDDHVADPPPSAFFFTVALSSPSSGALLGTPAVVSNYIVDAYSYIRPAGAGDTSFNPGTGMNGPVLALTLQSSGKIVAAGGFTSVNGVPKNYVARLNTDGTLDNTGFLYGLAGANGTVYALADQSDDKILVGGAFTSFNGAGIVRNRITRLNTDGSLDSSFNPGAGADSAVYSVAETFIGGVRKIYAGGAFSTMGGVSHPNLVRLNDNGSVDGGFAPGTGPNGTVFAVAAYPTNSVFAGKVLVGGAFSSLNNFSVGNIARLNADGSPDTNFNFNLSASDTVRAIAIQSDGSVLIGGDFTSVDGVAMNHVARLNSDGSLDGSFNIGAGINGTVNGIAVQADGRIVVVGQFSQANGVTRNGITRLLPNGAADPSINFGDGANGAVDAAVIQPSDQMIVIGGAFTQYNDQPAGRIARIYGGSETGSGAFEFTSATYQVDENGAQALIGIRRTGGTSGTNADGSGNVSVTFATVPGGTNPAVAGVNYLSVNQNVSFAPGEVLIFVPVPVLDDSNITANLTVTLTLSNPTSPAILGDVQPAQLIIFNDDSAVSFASANYSVAKNNLTGYGTLDVQRIGTTNGTCTVDYLTTTNGTAVSGTDYYPTNGTITFNPGETDKLIYVPIINNGIPEGNRTVILSLTNNLGTLLYAPSNAVLTIVDTVATPGQLHLSSASYTAGSGDGNVVLTVLRTNGTAGSVSVSYATQPGTALPGVDYNTVSGTVTFNDGDTTKSFAVPLINNPSPHIPVSFSVFLSNPSGGASLIAPTNATVTIINTNAGVTFALGTNFFNENAGTASIVVTRVGNSNGVVTVQYGTTNGTAVAGVNFTAVSGPLTFGNGETLKVISVPLIYSPLVTGDLQFTVGLSSANPAVAIVAPKVTTVILHDADAGLSFTNAPILVAKNGGSALITVYCSNTNVEPVSVNYSTADGSAVANVHYVPTSGTLTFSNGVATNFFAVPIISNGIIETNRSFTVNLSNPTPPGQLIPPSSQTVTIVEANNGFNFSRPLYTVLRNGGVAATITVLRTGNTNSVASVSFSATNGTAVNGLDYIATNGVFIFTNGVTSQSFQVPVLGNTTVQPDKTVLLQLFNPTNSILSAPSAATLTIHDTSGSLVVAAGSALTREGFVPANGIIDPGENVTLLFAFRASGGTNINNVYATLLPTNGITSPSPSGAVSYGSLAVGGPSKSQPFSFTAIGTNSQLIAATFQISNGLTNIGTAVFTYTLGTWTNYYSNSAAIIINDNAAASPYPSTINVSGIGGSLIKATVTFTNLTHKSPGDIDALLVSPSQLDTLLMVHAGAQNAVNHVTLTFDDAASNSLPQTGQIVSGTNKPTAYLPVKNFP
jgi:uncharacterized delta-60 repeat protein